MPSACSETQEHLQAIGLKLGKAPVAADARTQVELLAGVSRQADSVVSGLSALPLSHIAMSDTMKFCNQLSEYTMVLALSVSAGQPLTEQQTTELSSLESQCALLLGQFATARETMVAESLRLTAQPGVFYAEAQAAQRPLEQVADPDNGMDYPSMIYDGAFSDARHYGTPKALGEERIDQRQAMEIASAFVGEERVERVEAAPDSGGTLASYGVTLFLNDGVVLNAEVTRQGGKMLWMVPEHADFEPALTLEECAEAARAFLLDRGYGEMEDNHYQVYDGLAVINFVAVQDGVLLYPDLVKVQIRMDTGEVVGLEANNYLMNHTSSHGLAPALSAQEALEKVSPRLEAGSGAAVRDSLPRGRAPVLRGAGPLRRARVPRVHRRADGRGSGGSDDGGQRRRPHGGLTDALPEGKVPRYERRRARFISGRRAGCTARLFCAPSQKKRNRMV